MKYQIGLIGPGKLLGRIVRKLSSLSENPTNMVVGVCVTDQELVDSEVAVYPEWRALIRDCQLDFLVLLSSDNDLKRDVRDNLPESIDLVEELPGKAGIINVIARSVFKSKLDRKNRFLESLVESLPFPAFTFNRFGIVTHWNSSCERFTKVSGDSVIGKREIGRLFYYQDRPLIGQMLLKSYSLDQYREFFPDQDLEITADADSVLVKGFMGFKGTMQGYYQITSQKIILDGDVIGVIELIQDLNALTFLQEEASRKQAALHSIVNHLPFPMLQTAVNGRVIFINKAGVDMFRQMTDGQSESERDLFSACPEIKEVFSDFIRSLSDDEGQVLIQERQLNKTVYWNDEHWDVTCLNPPGQSQELVWTIRNVSTREKESQLNTALAMVGTVCHELSQPLTAIINSSQLLAKTKSGDLERAARHQKIIDEQGERLFNIYRKLQNITQVRLQKYLDTQILDLEESAEDFRARKEDS